MTAVVRAVVATVLAVLLIVGLLWTFQRRLVYFPGSARPPAAAQRLPGATDISFRTADGLLLRGWFLPVRDAIATVLVFNGNAGDRSDRAPLAEALADARMSVLLFDYRGYAGNPGRPTEAGLAADARAALSYVQSRSDVTAARLVYLGESLGAAVAVRLAAEHPPGVLVLRSPFTSLADVGAVHYPYLPVRALLRDRFDSASRIAGLRVPLLVVAGDADGVVPVVQSRRLFRAAAEPKRYVEVPGAGHNDIALLAGDRVVAAVVAFVREWI